jgi:hypothetical protein
MCQKPLTAATILYAIDPVTGVAAAIGAGMGHDTACSNLGAPWTAVACLEAR